MSILEHGMILGKAKVFVDILPMKNTNTRPGRKIKATHVTYHNTGSPGKGGDAKAHNNYIHRLANAAPGTLSNSKSWHFTVDDGAIYQHIPVDENAWHCGDGAGVKAGNMVSIGIEICMHSDQKDYHQAEENAIALGVHLAKMLGIPDANHVPHQHWSGKFCPSVILTRDKGFQKFHQRVMAAKNDPVAAPVAPTAPAAPVVEAPKPAPVVPVAPIAPGQKAIGTVTILVDALNVRSEANFSSAVKDVARKGQKFDVYETKDGLHRISAGWVSASERYVKFEKIVEVPAAPVQQVIGHAVIKASALNVRKEASFSSPAVDTVGKGQKFSVYEIKDGLYKIGESRWISASATYTSFVEIAKPTIKVGSRVRVTANAKSYTGSTVASFIYRGVYTVDNLDGNRAVLDKKGICTPFHIKDLSLETAQAAAPVVKAPVKVAKEGSKVKVRIGAKTYTGGSVASFIYNGTYTIDDLNGDRAVLDKKGICTPFKVKDLILL